METTRSLSRGKWRWILLLLPVFLFNACNRQEAPESQTPNPPATNEQAEALQRWRANREVARANAATETAQTKPNTNAIDSAKALQSINSFSERLKSIVGNSFEDAKKIREKAESGDAAAQSQLAVSFAQQGDYASALKWYLKAAEQGDSRAEHALGVMYVVGQGTDIDFAEAVKWFTRAAEQGDVDSQYSLGVRYAKGDHVQQNFAESVRWFSMAANQGQPDAQVSLSRRYANGEGVQKDVVEAYKWVKLAGDYWSAPGVRNLLETTMTPEQITEGQKRADAFQPVKTGKQ